MITSEGKRFIKRYLAGYVPAYARSISFGIGARAESLADTALHLETGQATIYLSRYDFVNDEIVFKASIPDNYVGKIYEIGIYSLVENPSQYRSRIITPFDSFSEQWLTAGAAAAFSTSNPRVGSNALYHDPAASGSRTSTLSNISIDLSGHSAADSFTFGFNSGNAFTSSIRYRFLTDASNYYDFTLTTPGSGYIITERAMGTAVVTGTPSWSNITEIQVTTNSTAGGAAAIEHDVIRLEDKDAQSVDYVLVARKVLPTPVTKVEGQVQDIEFTLDVTL